MFDTPLSTLPSSIMKWRAPVKRGRGVCARSADEHLGPVVPGGHIPHADLGIGGVEDIGPVAAGVHPAVDHLLGRPLAVGDVFPGGAVAQAEGLRRGKLFGLIVEVKGTKTLSQRIFLNNVFYE